MTQEVHRTDIRTCFRQLVQQHGNRIYRTWQTKRTVIYITVKCNFPKGQLTQLIPIRQGYSLYIE